MTLEPEDLDRRAAAKAIVHRHFVDGVNGHDLRVWDEIMAVDYQLHVGLRRDLLRGGRAGYQAGRMAEGWVQEGEVSFARDRGFDGT